MTKPKEVFLSLEESKQLREKYIASFIDTEGWYYREHIIKIENGYFWDCFISPSIIEYTDILKSSSLNKEVFVLWDKRSSTPFLHFNIEQVLIINMQELLEARNRYTEDVYIFDDTFTWRYALTHEKNDYGRRLCFEQKAKGHPMTNSKESKYTLIYLIEIPFS